MRKFSHNFQRSFVSGPTVQSFRNQFLAKSRFTYHFRRSCCWFMVEISWTISVFSGRILKTNWQRWVSRSLHFKFPNSFLCCSGYSWIGSLSLWEEIDVTLRNFLSCVDSWRRFRIRVCGSYWSAIVVQLRVRIGRSENSCYWSDFLVWHDQEFCAAARRVCKSSASKATDSFRSKVNSLGIYFPFLERIECAPLWSALHQFSSIMSHGFVFSAVGKGFIC